jgi:hypothetical protein
MTPFDRAPRAPRPLAAAACCIALLAGCATTDEVRYGNVVAVPNAYAYTPATQATDERPLSLGEIVADLREGAPQDELADEIRERGILAPATDADIDLLLQAGATDELVDAVQAASSEAARGATGAPSAVYGASSTVYVTPPPTVVYDTYGWYPYAPYAPYSFGLWYHDTPRFGPSFRHRPHRGVRPPPAARPTPSPGWQSPRVNPPPRAPSPGSAVRPPSGSSRPDPRLPSAGGNTPNPLWQMPRPSSPRVPQDLPVPRQGARDPRLPAQ